MIREEVYLIDLSGAGFRCVEPAKIVGVEMCTPRGLVPRLCYHLRFSDNTEDFKPVNEPTYKLVTFSELLTGEFKKW